MARIIRIAALLTFFIAFGPQVYAWQGFLGFGAKNEDFEKAKQAYSQARYEEAIELLNKVTAKRPSEKIDRESYLLLGQSYEYTNQRDKAMVTYRYATALYPKDLDLSFSKAKLYCALELFDQARQTLQNILQVNPSHIDANIILGDVYMRLGFHSWASESYFKALSHTKAVDLELWNKYCGSLMKQRRFEEAESVINFMLKFAPPNADYLLLLSDIAFARGMYNKAIEYIAHAEKLSPHRKDLLIKHVLRLAENGNYKEAKEKLNPLIKNSPDALVYTTQGIIFLKEGFVKDAAAAFSKAKTYAKTDEDGQFMSTTADTFINIINEKAKPPKGAS